MKNLVMRSPSRTKSSTYCHFQELVLIGLIVLNQNVQGMMIVAYNDVLKQGKPH